MKARLASLILSTILLFPAGSSASSRIINGVPVPKGMFGEVLEIKTGGASCTATLVGPNVLVAAAHCFSDGANVELTVGGVTYTGEGVRHPDYPKEDIDVALVIMRQTIAGITPASIGSTIAVGDRVFLFGFGCTTPGGGGGNDGVLRMGESDVTTINASEFVTRRISGGALCFGDSGGPTMAKEAGKFRVVGINSKGNIQDTNYSTYLAVPTVQSFLKDTASKFGVAICGVTTNCQGPVPTEPHFKKQAFTFTLGSGDVLKQRLTALLDAPPTSVTFHLDPSAPQWMEIDRDELILAPGKDVVGSFAVSVTAKGQNGADATLIHINVTGPMPEAPTCTVTVTPSFIRLGESVTIEMRNVGAVSNAQLNGLSMPAGGGKKVIHPADSGVFTATGTVTGPGGSGTCVARYGVK